MGARGKELSSDESISSTWNAEKQVQCRWVCAGDSQHFTARYVATAISQRRGNYDVPAVV